MIGAIFLSFAVYLVVRPNKQMIEYDWSKREVPAPMVDASFKLGSHSYGFYSFQKGAYPIGDDLGILISSKTAKSALLFERGVQNGHMVYGPKNGASHAFTVIDLAGWRAGIPVGLHVLSGVMGILLMGLPFWVDVARRHSARKIAQHTAESDSANVLN